MKPTCNEKSGCPFYCAIHVVYFYGELTLVHHVHGLWTNVQYDEDASVRAVFMQENAVAVRHALLAQQPVWTFTCSEGTMCPKND